MLIGSREWHYAAIKQYDGSIAVVVTKPDGTAQSLLVTDVRYVADDKTIQFMCNGRRHVMRIASIDQQNKQFVVCAADGKAVYVKSLEYKRNQSLFLPAQAHQASLSGQSADSKTVKSPLAGRVTKILVLPGQSVVRGQPLLMIESMKMENELCAPADGSIKIIFIHNGDVVKPNQVLLSLEDEGDGHATAHHEHGSTSVTDR